MRIAVILNASAGATLRLGPNAVRRVGDAFAACGIETEVKALPGREIAAALARMIAVEPGGARGYDGIAVGGGDGTLGCAAGILAGSGIPLGILPLGTLNHFAKDLAIPGDIDAAAAVIAAGHVKAVDIGEVNGRVFVNNSSVGIYPFLVAGREFEQRRHGLGKVSAMGLALLRTLRGSSWHIVRVKVGSDQREVRTACVFVGNNFYDIGALGIRRGIEGGELCIYIVKQQTWIGLALLPFKVALGLADPASDVELLRGPDVEIRSNRGHLRVAIDGETTRLPPPLVYRIRPHGLDVFAPANPSNAPHAAQDFEEPPTPR